MKYAITGLLIVLMLGVGMVITTIVGEWTEPPATTTTTTIDPEYARCMAIQTHRSVLDYRDLETARYLADVACNDGKVRIP